MRILCYTDLPERAHDAVNIAAELAARYHDTVLLTHPGHNTGNGTPPISDATGGADHDGVLGRRKGGGIGSISTRDVPVKSAPLPDTSVHALAQIALPARTRLIVVAAPAAAAAHGWQPASDAETIAENSTVPTLVVRAPEPLLDWLQAGRVLKVFCAYDFSATADAALAYLINLRRLGPCEVVVAHVGWLPEEKARLGIKNSVCQNGDEPSVRQIIERDLRERVDAILGAEAGARILFKGSWSRPDFDLVNLATEAQADLVVTGTHQWHGLERLIHRSVSRFLLRHAPMNVLVVPRTGAAGEPPAKHPRRILVATDFSEAGNAAVRHAYAMLHGGGTVRLLHVTHPQALSHCEYEQGIGDRETKGKHERHLKACTARLQALARGEAAGNGIITEVEVAENSEPASGIMQAAERFGADVIYLGTHERSGLSAVISPPLAQRIMAKCKRPLLVVHPPKP